MPLSASSVIASSFNECVKYARDVDRVKGARTGPLPRDRPAARNASATDAALGSDGERSDRFRRRTRRNRRGIDAEQLAPRRAHRRRAGAVIDARHPGGWLRVAPIVIGLAL
ncbi:hypothetical protein GCM10027515_10490 [Schumannella luteola]